MDIVRSIPMNRAKYRELDAKMRRVTRSLACTSGCAAPGTHLLDGLDTSGSAGNEKFASITSAIGVTLSSPALANAAKDRANPALLRRVTSLAAVIGLAVTEKPQSQWYEILGRITTRQTADKTRLLASKLALGPDTGFTIALTFAFLQGAVGDVAGIDDDSVLGYRRAMEAFDGAMEQIRRGPAVRSQGLAGLGAINESVIQTGNCGLTYFASDKIANIRPKFQKVFGRAATDAEIEYYGRMKWCSKPDEKSMDTAMQNIKNANVGTMPSPDRFPGGPAAFEANFATRTFWGDTSAAISQGADFIANWIKDHIGDALDYVIVQLRKLGTQASTFLCSGFKKLFPDPVGGVLCDIVRIVIGGLTSGVVTIAAVMKTLFIGLGEFFAGLLKFNKEGLGDAVMALVKMINKLVVIILGGPFSDLLGLPVVDAELTQAQKDEGLKSLETLGAELPPTFTLGLVAGVLGVIFGGPTGIPSLIVTLTPAITSFLAPALKRSSIKKFRDMSLVDIEKGINVIIKIGAMVLSQVMSIQDTIMKFGRAIRRYIDRLKADPSGELKKLSDNFATEFTSRWKNFVEEIKSCSVTRIIKATKELLKSAPDVLIAIAKDDPDLADAYEAGKQIFATAAQTYAQAQTMWAAEFKAAPTDDDKIAVLKKQIDEAKAQVESARRALKSLCEKKPSDPACKLLEDPVKVETKTVTVEKIIYRDRPAGGSPVGPQPKGTTVITAKTTPGARVNAGSMAIAAVAAGGLLLALGLMSGRK